MNDTPTLIGRISRETITIICFVWVQVATLNSLTYFALLAFGQMGAYLPYPTRSAIHLLDLGFPVVLAASATISVLTCDIVEAAPKTRSIVIKATTILPNAFSMFVCFSYLLPMYDFGGNTR